MFLRISKLVFIRESKLDVGFLLFISVVLLGGLTGCSLFMNNAAARIKVIDEETADSCDKVGDIQVKVIAKLGAINREPSKVKAEADSFAAVKAVDLNATAILSLDDPKTKEDNRSYAAYVCPDKKRSRNNIN